jgi:hypothetical protein
MCFIFSNFLASYLIFSYNSFYFKYFLASFQQPFNAFNNILASFVLFFVFLQPLSLDCRVTIPLFLLTRPSRRSLATMCPEQDHGYRLSDVHEVVK